ncbi:MAG TPA: GGDEF domain-containing protein [Gammaproteobacteria bacterium]|nr:GGDEF domain-containing protein [Gammaproteobacteria bacterium]
MLVVLTAVAAAVAIAPVIFFWVEGSDPPGVYVAAAATAALVAAPLVGLFLLLLRDVVRSENTAASMSRQSDRQSRIFRSLLEVSLALQRKASLEALLHEVLIHLRRLYPETAFAIVVFGNRSGVLRYLEAAGMAYRDLQQLSTNALMLAEDDPSRALDALSGPDGRAGRIGWRLLRLRGREGDNIGRLILKGPALTSEEIDVVRIFRDQIGITVENKLLNLELERLANTDSLTGLYNRSHFQRQFEQQQRLRDRTAGPDFSLVLVDINGLKGINDTQGHPAGDRLIQAAGQLLQRCTRADDIVCRIGGDEFMILCPSTTLGEAERLIARIREAVPALAALVSPAGSVGLSLGAASTTEVAPGRLMQLADSRMYEDKRTFYGDRRASRSS